MKNTFTLVRKRNQWGEFVVKCWRDGKRYPDGDYHTDDWDDACQTLKSLNEWSARHEPA